MLKKLLELGFRVSKPFDENNPYDLVCDTGKALLRIQVKSTSVQQGAGLYKIVPRHAGGVDYDPGSIDFFVLVVFDKEPLFYVVPAEALQELGVIAFYPNKSRCIMSLYYQNRWDRLENIEQHNTLTSGKQMIG